MIEITVTDSQGNKATKSVELTVQAASKTFRESRPMIVGGATTNDQQGFNALQNAWGPIRATREYDSAKGILPVQNYAWYDFTKANFKNVVFSLDEENHQYPDIAAGAFDTKIQAMINSVKTNLSNDGFKGVITLGNEPNADKGISPSDYRAAIEHCIDTFGDVPAPGFVWGVAFSNYNVWGQGSTAGEAWLPRRDNKKFCVGTHCYGRTDFTPASNMIGRTFVPAMNKPGRKENWIWGIGETSAQENPSNPDTKGLWFKDFADFVAQNGGSFWMPFDTNVGGSADVGSTPRTAAHVKQISQKYASNNWTA